MARTTEPHGLLGLGGLRLTRRGRVVVVLLALVLSAAAGLVGQRAVAEAPAGPVEVRLHAVAPGESLWDYASQLVEVDEDVRDVVADLRALNRMDSADLQVGQVVLLPVR
ncbi:LysM peptidoglycan-binding domain-containing protein [Isoptericola sp. BMS4]|uniref:LysM peptidoglycan-binding domain-containing protein n=1 Tax=Isoptericola sp. BMS4 TaxID=2527875 RepID=UPI00142070B6|nr:LysM peptidoglycan-binding domain-containing protein [Isoptericola sp. BMS4]